MDGVKHSRGNGGITSIVHENKTRICQRVPCQCNVMSTGVPSMIAINMYEVIGTPIELS